MTVLQTHWLKLSVHAFCFSIMACSPAVLTSAKEKKDFQVAVQELHRMLHRRAVRDRSKNSQIKMHVLEIVRSLQTCCDLMYESVEDLAADAATVSTLQRHGNDAYDLVRGNRFVDYGNYPYSVMLKMICMSNADICLAIRRMARRIPTLSGLQPDTHDALLNQGNVIETLMTCDYPLDEASRNPEQLWRNSCRLTPGPRIIKKTRISNERIGGELGWVCRLIVLNASDASSCIVQTLDI